jgi:hypothetical protein
MGESKPARLAATLWRGFGGIRIFSQGRGLCLPILALSDPERINIRLSIGSIAYDLASANGSWAR